MTEADYPKEPGTHDTLEWTVYFVEMRKRILQEQGYDIADDVETMHAWFCMVHMHGYDRAKWEEKFRDAGVENIDEWLQQEIFDKVSNE